MLLLRYQLPDMLVFSVASADSSEIREMMQELVPDAAEVDLPSCPKKACQGIKRPRDEQSFPGDLRRGRTTCEYMRLRKALKRERAPSRRQ